MVCNTRSALSNVSYSLGDRRGLKLTVKEVIDSRPETNAENSQSRADHFTSNGPGDRAREAIVEEIEHQRESNQSLTCTVRVTSHTQQADHQHADTAAGGPYQQHGAPTKYLVHKEHSAHCSNESETVLHDGRLKWLLNARHLIEERAVRDGEPDARSSVRGNSSCGEDCASAISALEHIQD